MNKVYQVKIIFIPSTRTTKGTVNPTFFTALITPLAIVAQLTIPPNTFTKIAFTVGSEIYTTVKSIL